MSRPKSFASQLKAWRKAHPGQNLAVFLDVPNGTLNNWLQGRRRPTPFVRKVVLFKINNYS